MIVKLLYGSNPVYKTVRQKLILFLSCQPRIPVQKCLPPCSCRTASLYVYLRWWIACLQLHSQGQKLKSYLNVINQQVVKLVQDRDSWKKVVEQARTLHRLQHFIRRRISKWLDLTTFKRHLSIGGYVSDDSVFHICSRESRENVLPLNFIIAALLNCPC